MRESSRIDSPSVENRSSPAHIISEVSVAATKLERCASSEKTASSSDATSSEMNSHSDLHTLENENENADQPSSQRVISTAATLPRTERAVHALNEEKIAAHIERFLLAGDNRGRSFVYSSTQSGTDVYCFAPSEQLGRDYWTLVTMGMSGTPMKVPSDIKQRNKYEHAEVICYLPPNWQFPTTLGGAVTEQSWPVEMLRSLARYVHTTGAWLGQDHGVPNLLSDPPGQRFAPSTKLSHMILLSPVNESESFGNVHIGHACVNFYVVVPLTEREAQWKRERGAEKSIYYVVGSRSEERDDVYIDYIIDPQRRCAVEDLHCREVFDRISSTTNSEGIAAVREGEEDESYGEFEDLASSGSGSSEDNDQSSTDPDERSDPSTDLEGSSEDSSERHPFTSSNKRIRIA